MSARPTVTIVTRTKDRAILLDRALQDVAAQSFTDFEMVIVNDGGDPAEVDALLEKHAEILKGRARVIHNPESMGMEHASNLAIESSTGKYICIHDDDDTWAPTFLEECVSFMADHPDHGGVAVRTQIVLEQIRGMQVVEQGRMMAWPHIKQFSLSELMTSNIAVPISCMYPRSVVEDLGGFRADLPVVGDWEFHLRLAVKYDVGFIDGEPLAFWHQRRTQRGAMGNSVFDAAEKHRYFDLKVRDEYLREYARINGVGALLWQASMFAQLRENSGSLYVWTRRKFYRLKELVGSRLR